MKKLPKKTSRLPQLPDPDQNGNTLQFEKNHAAIAGFIQQHIEENGSMPCKSLIAQALKFSRETVYKHYQVFKERQEDEGSLDNLMVMTEHVVALVLKSAMRGDPKAQRLFLEIMGKYNNPKGGKKAGSQNNFVQINKTIINQQIIQQLKPEQIDRLEQFIANELQNKKS
jgi:hypothetical protein